MKVTHYILSLLVVYDSIVDEVHYGRKSLRGLVITSVW